ncbi:hypothetical protein Q7P37_001903 [Cladosporium fusiforme]
MADMATQTQPRTIPGIASKPPAPSSLAIPKSVQSLRPGQGLSVDTSSPVTQNGSYEFDRIIKAGEVLKRTRKTKSWKPVYIVLRPNLLSIYRDSTESKLKHQIILADLTAVARQKDPKRKGKHVFGLFSPSRNFHLEAQTDLDAQEWVERIRDSARMDEHEEEISLASPSGAKSMYQGFERSKAMSPQALASDDRSGGYSSSDAEAFGPSSYKLPKRRDKASVTATARRPSQIESSGVEGYGSYSDFSDSMGPTSRMSALSLSHSDSRPATGSAPQHTSPTSAQIHSVYGPVPHRPAAGQRNPSQLSANQADAPSKPSVPEDKERVVYHNWILLLRPKRGVRQWKKVWMVVRPRALALYKNEDEYRPLLILPFESIIDTVEIDPISKSKQYCLQVISEERNYRFCALDEECLNRWLGAFKSVLSKRRAASRDVTANAVVVGS